MRATSSPSTLTDASLTRCTSARTLAYSARMAAVDVVDAYLVVDARAAARAGSPTASGASRCPARTLGGEPLDAGLRIADGLLRAQALALHAASDLDPWMLLWWNRQTRLVRFGCTRSRDIWVHADLPVSRCGRARASTALLGLVTEAAVAVRGRAARSG